MVVVGQGRERVDTARPREALGVTGEAEGRADPAWGLLGRRSAPLPAAPGVSQAASVAKRPFFFLQALTHLWGVGRPDPGLFGTFSSPCLSRVWASPGRTGSQAVFPSPQHPTRLSTEEGPVNACRMSRGIPCFYISWTEASLFLRKFYFPK